MKTVPDRSAAGVDLNAEELTRYSRHLILPEVGLTGQRRLKGASALVVGAGGLGSPIGMYLAAAGIGRIGLVDFDTVDETNLQRQVLYETADVGRRKLEVARRRLLGINPHVRIDLHDERLVSANALDVLADYDVILDGTDNFPTRYLVNDACVMLQKPNVYGSIFRFEGQVSVFAAAGGPCYRCLFPEPPPPGLVPSCAEGGVLGVLPGIIGTLQATEALKLILGEGDPLVGRLLLVDTLHMRFRQVNLRRDPECAVCGERPTVTELIDYESFCGMDQQGMLVTGEADSAGGTSGVEALPEVDPRELQELLQSARPPLLLDVRNREEWDLCRLDGATHVPLHLLSLRMDELPRDCEIVVYCKMGARSAHAVRMLEEEGFTRVKNLRGGILAWSREIDPTLPRY